MSLEGVARRVPPELRPKVSDGLVDLILNSANVGNMPSGSARAILYRWRRDELTNEVGLVSLLEASMRLEAQKTLELLKRLGLSELAVMIEGGAKA